MKSIHKVILMAVLGMLVFSPPAARGQFIFDENPLVGKQAPDFTLKTLEGSEVSLNQYRGTDPALVFFWATWCPHCRDELRTIAKQADLFQKNGIKIVLVNLEENPRQVKAFVDKLKLPYNNVFLDETSKVGEQYSIIGLPTVFFIDKDGVIARMEFGLPENFMETLKAKAPNKS